MKIHLNGEEIELPQGLKVAAMLAHLDLPRAKVAVERNLEIVPKSQFDEVVILDGDRLEIVHFIGGG
ncbi:MAG: sulfur carrier protein ThiS [Alphaproteobacteria bacterium]|nr:MAG: sulfur carrier protein ThiS [Alphaproteobacteria bacterium]